MVRSSRKERPIPECPVFHPTVEEFADPMDYIAQIQPAAVKAGICRIVPPSAWRPPFALDVSNFRFPTRLQNLSRIGGWARISRDFAKEIRLFMFKRGTPLLGPVGIKVVSQDQQDSQEREIPIDLYQLYKAVKTRGGSAELRQSQWVDIAKELGIEPEYGHHLRKAYSKWLGPYEAQSRSSRPKADIDASQEGHPLGSALTGRGTKTEAHTCSLPLHEASPSKQHSDLEPGARTRLSPQSDLQTKRALIGRRFWRFFPPNNLYLEGTITAPESGGRYTVRYASKDRASKDVKPFHEGISRRELLVLLANGERRETAKAVQFLDFCEICFRTVLFGPLTECYNCGALRHAQCLDPPRDIMPKGDWFCPDCLIEKDPDIDKPSKSTIRMKRPRAQSTAPPVEQLLGNFGFEDGAAYTLTAFERMAEEWRHDYFTKALGHSNPTEPEIEREFWRIVNGGKVHSATEHGYEGCPRCVRDQPSDLSQAPIDLKVEYGSELDTATFGSAFPVLPHLLPDPDRHSGMTVDSKDIDTRVHAYRSSGWNINNLPVATGSMLNHLDVPVTGVVVPWLYIGMALSAFCWHAEDHYLYSINYLHKGRGAKAWYGIPGSHAETFEALVHDLYPELFDKSPDLMLQLVTMIDPAVIANRGIPVYKTSQHVGDFVVTFPGAYHGGFNFGFNVAEAVNFAPPDILPWSGKAQELYRRLHRAPVFSHDQLVIATARAVSATPARETAECLPYVTSELERMILASSRRAQAARQVGITRIVEEACDLSLALEAQADQDPVLVKPVMLSVEQRRGTRRRASPQHSEASPITPERRAGPCRKGRQHLSTSRSSVRQQPIRQPRHCLHKGAQCYICKQYCYLEQAFCTGSPSCGMHRTVCGEHLTQACASACSPAKILYRSRCSEQLLKSLLSSLRDRASTLEKLSTGVRDVQACLPRSNKTSSSLPLLSIAAELGGGSLAKERSFPSEVHMSQGKLTYASGISRVPLSGSTPACDDNPLSETDRLAHRILALMDDIPWQARPDLSRILALHEEGKYFGLPRAEMLSLTRILTQAKAAWVASLDELPVGTLHLSSTELRFLSSARRGSRRHEKDTTAYQPCKQSISLLEILHWTIRVLDYPVRCGGLLVALFQSLTEVTCMRRVYRMAAGVQESRDLDCLEACVERARHLLPGLISHSPAASEATLCVKQALPRRRMQSAHCSADEVKARWNCLAMSYTPSVELREVILRLRKLYGRPAIVIPEDELLDHVMMWPEGIGDANKYLTSKKRKPLEHVEEGSPDNLSRKLRYSTRPTCSTWRNAKFTGTARKTKRNVLGCDGPL